MLNHLAKEQSPYLLQHINNPVEWYPWCQEAFDKAQSEDKPIFLSIGYSACHWCHVMAHESFEDNEVANLLNESFVSVKVDREERPDLDSVYMNVCQMLTGSGGWPLTVVMTPDKKPFFAGTYFPKASNYGRIGMLELIPRLQEFWKNRRSEVLNSAESIVQAIQKSQQYFGDCDLNEQVLKSAYENLLSRFDTNYAGFGSNPKFPMPHNLTFLLRSNNSQALQMVEKTLIAMRLGGIYDQVGFGFHRYSTDQKWLLPHFEKMLYDQAGLSIAYIEAFQITQNVFYKQVADEIFSYVLRDLQSDEGGFYSAEDADSEGEEGKFYTWSEAEIKQILGSEESQKIIESFNIETEGNYFDEAHKNKNGYNILHAKQLSSLDFDWEKARNKLFEVRKKRIKPQKDTKILTDWNGFMIAALAKGFQAFQNMAYLESAEKALAYILQNLQKPNGELKHAINISEAYLNDYAFLIWALIELYQANFKSSYLKLALQLTEITLNNFWDNGFCFTSANSPEKLFARSKEIYDGAIPSGNSIMAQNLLSLSLITGENHFENKAKELFKAFSEEIKHYPSSHVACLSALNFLLKPNFLLVLSKIDEPIEKLQKKFFPQKMILQKNLELTELIGFIKNYEQKGIYICQNGACQQPLQNLKEVIGFLEKQI